MERRLRLHFLTLLFVVFATAALGAGCAESIQTGGGRDASTDEPAPDADIVPGPAVSELRLVAEDAEWRVDGQPISATAPALRSLPGHNAFWFAWSIFHPGTPIFEGPATRQATIQGDDQCTVPCDQISPACGGRDCIPSLQSPTMVPVGDPALGYLRDTDEVLGVITSEGPRAYPHNILWWHEIINETVGGQSYAVTYCPLTGSGINYDRSRFVDGQVIELGVSGNLYNSNLTMYDRTTESFWSQMRLESVSGERIGTPTPVLPVFEMTWRAWRELHPDTLVVSSDTGHRRDYQRYPYSSYRTDNDNTFRVTDPAPDPSFDNKDFVFGLLTENGVKGYPWETLAQTVGSRRGVIQDEVDGLSVLIVFDLDRRFVHAFDASVDGSTRTFSLEGSGE
ncbi:MAG: DUF3179 domain-containing protein [Myxococcota bacterium]